MSKKNIARTSPPPEERILAAATAEFAAKGFFGARTQAIADKAGVNKAMLHYYFRSKEKLYGEVIKAAFTRIMTQAGGAWLGPESLPVRLERVVDSYMDNYTQNPGFLKIVMREVVDGGERLGRALSELKTEDLFGNKGTIAEMIGRVGAELNLGPAEATHMIVNIVGMCVISFVSPPVLEAVAGFNFSDFEAYLQQRRDSIKSVVSAYVQSRVSDF